MARRLFAALAASALLLGLFGPAAVSAKDPPTRLQPLDLSRVDPSLRFRPSVLRKDRAVRVIVELSGEPVALRQRDATAVGRTLTRAERVAVRGQVRASQTGVADAISGLGGKVISTYQDAYNGLRVLTTTRHIAAIAALPGVVAVHALTIVALPRPSAEPVQPSNVNTVPYIGAPQVWSDTGLTGAGIKIAVIDTGIDYYHADLGGSGNPSDFADADRTSLADGGFPNAKVAGGYDFAGDDYDADPTSPTYQPIPHPDPDPLDCIYTSGDLGHGSHVAGTAAGNGVLADGTAYTGPYTDAALASNSWTIGPGVAPQATLYAYRVFGCNGTTDLTIDAIDRAVADGVDVINLSLGAPFGHADSPDAVAADNAALAGVVVVASAGNRGADSVLGTASPAFITDTPASADRAIAVAALDAIPTLPGARIDLASGPIPAVHTNPSTLPVTGHLRVLLTPPDADGKRFVLRGCDAADYRSVVAGDIVVAVRGVCDRVTRAELGQAAGAAAVVMINNQFGLPPYEGVIPGVTIPFLGVDASAEAALIAANGQTVTIVPTAPLDSPSYKTLAPFSSGGPRDGDNAPKPDIAAPGVGVVSTASGTGTQGQTLSGTSMASPATAGVAALVVQAHPTWSVEKVKSALMSTATGSAGAGGLVDYSVIRAGAGVVAARRAVDTVGLVTTSGGRDSLAFGYEPHDGGFAETKPMTIWNTSGSAIGYGLSVTFSGDPLGSTVSISPAGVTVPAHGKVTVDVRLAMSASELAGIDLDLFSAGLTTVSGVVIATPRTAGPGRYPLRVPFLVSPRGLSDVQPGRRSRASFIDGVAAATQGVSNTGIHPANLDVYAWGLADANEGRSTYDVRAVGVQTYPADLDGDGTADDDFIVFAVNTWGRWGSGSDDEFDISIDVDKDGAADYVVAGVDTGLVLTGAPSGDQASFVFDAAGHLIRAWPATAPANGSTMLMPVLASDLGLKPGASAFDYTVEGSTILSAAPPDSVPGVGHFDPLAPAVSQADHIALAPGASVTLPVSVNAAAFAANPALGWMLVALDDANGHDQADLVPVLRLP
jgi:minor extracellular serine protease Vpr